MRIYKPNDPYNGEDKKGYHGVQRFNEDVSQRSRARSTRSNRSKRRIMTAVGQRRGQTTQQVVDEVRRRKTGVSKVNREVASAQKREKDLFETLGGETGEAAETPLPQPAEDEMPQEPEAHEPPHEEEKLQIYDEKVCHELNCYIKFHDPSFFDKVVYPFVSNKLNKTFVDLCLIDSPQALCWAQIFQY